MKITTIIDYDERDLEIIKKHRNLYSNDIRKMFGEIFEVFESQIEIVYTQSIVKGIIINIMYHELNTNDNDKDAKMVPLLEDSQTVYDFQIKLDESIEDKSIHNKLKIIYNLSGNPQNISYKIINDIQ
eukprot:331422_1